MYDNISPDNLSWNKTRVLDFQNNNAGGFARLTVILETLPSFEAFPDHTNLSVCHETKKIWPSMFVDKDADEFSECNLSLVIDKCPQTSLCSSWMAMSTSCS